MEKRIILLFLSVLFISCEREKTELLLGQWVGQGEVVFAANTVCFNTDNTYVETTFSTLHILYNHWQQERLAYRKLTTIGNWNRQDNTIIFGNKSISTYLVDSTMSAINDDSFFGNDNIKIVDFGNDSSYNAFFRNQRTVWMIQKLTKDSLIVDSDGIILKYYRPYRI
jgi:hypothetical protein